jgi:hypothetical protein
MERMQALHRFDFHDQTAANHEVEAVSTVDPCSLEIDRDWNFTLVGNPPNAQLACEAS